MDLREKLGKKIRDLDISIWDAGNPDEQANLIVDSVIEVVAEHYRIVVPKPSKLEPEDVTDEHLALLVPGSQWEDSYGGRDVIVLRHFPTVWKTEWWTVEMMEATGWKRESHMLAHGFFSRFTRREPVG